MGHLFAFSFYNVLISVQLLACFSISNILLKIIAK